MTNFQVFKLNIILHACIVLVYEKKSFSGSILYTSADSDDSKISYNPFVCPITPFILLDISCNRSC